MSPKEFSEAIQAPNVFLLDVRPKEDFRVGHIKDAHNLDVTDPNFILKAKAILPKDDIIAVYCKTGKHSALAQQELINAGYKVINLDHGIDSWTAANYPITN